MKWNKGNPKKSNGDYIVANKGISKIRMGIGYWNGSEWEIEDGNIGAHQVEYWLELPPHPYIVAHPEHYGTLEQINDPDNKEKNKEEFIPTYYKELLEKQNKDRIESKT